MSDPATCCSPPGESATEMQGFLAALYKDELPRHAQCDSSRWAARQASALERLRAELVPRGQGADIVAPARTITDDSRAASLMPTAVKGASDVALDSVDALSPASSLGDLTQADTHTNNNDNTTTMMTVRPNLSGISHISPDKNEPPSLLFLCSTLAGVTRAEAGLDTPAQKRSAAASTVGECVSHSVGPRGEAMSISAAVFVAQRTLRQRQLRAELEASEMAECTFQPTLAPGTRAMVQRRRRQLECEVSCTAESGASPDSPAATRPDADTSRTTLSCQHGESASRQQSDVYMRLFSSTTGRGGASSAVQPALDATVAVASRRAWQEEQWLLRRYCQAPYGQPQDGQMNDMDVFLGNVLSGGAQQATHAWRVRAVYQSPMAIAFAREASRAARRAGGHSSVCKTAAPHDAAVSAPRGHNFDAFLQRQAELGTRKACSVQQLEQELTPAFRPTTTRRSDQLVARMIERSTLEQSHTRNNADDEGCRAQDDNASNGGTRSVTNPELSSIEAAKRDRSISLLTVRAAMVKKHRSPYVDPCTFHPRIAPATRAHYAGKSSQSPRTRYEVLYDDHARRVRAREAARRRAAEAAVEGLTFSPSLNTRRNAAVQSLLQPENEGHYMQYLQARRAAARAAREAQLAEAARAQERECTFAPRTSRLPSYITSMATSFGLARRQDVEF